MEPQALRIRKQINGASRHDRRKVFARRAEESEMQDDKKTGCLIWRAESMKVISQTSKTTRARSNNR